MTERSQPRIENAPGLVLRARKAGWAAIWQARHDLIQRGYPIKQLALELIGDEPTDEQRAYISDKCISLQADMLAWGHGGTPTLGMFDGTLGSLIDCYQTDADSAYRKARYRTRLNYDSLCRRVMRDHGDELLADIKARLLLRWHEDWIKSGIPTAHSLMGMLRIAFGFGVTMLESAECERLCGVLHHMKFPMGRPRKERMTAEQANAIRAKAHEMKVPEIALAQALQFECTLRQKDVIGEWVPMEEPGMSLTTHNGMKWLRGLRWEEIDANLTLRHTTSKKDKDIEVDLHLAPMVLEELARFGGMLPANGPIIVKEHGRPYRTQNFREQWRKVATAAGVPKNVWNMDTRAGAITEATDAGADLEHVRHAATHSNINMTQRYSRGGIEKTAGVMRQRVASRNKPGKS